MNFLNEIINRIFLILFVWFYLIINCYYYKKILFFLLLNKLILNKNVQIYFLYTNITEFFYVYLKLINFFVIQIITLFCYYHLFVFLTPALYKNELLIIKKLAIILILIWQINFVLIIIVIFPFIYNFFKYFEKLFLKNLLHLEIKIFDYFELFYKIYFFFTILFFVYYNNYFFV